MNSNTLIAAAAMAALVAGAAHAAVRQSAGKYAEPAQPIAYDKLNAYMKASPRQRASSDWADNSSAAASTPAASAAGGGYTGVDTSATTAPQPMAAPQAGPDAPTPQPQPSMGTNP